MTLPNTDFDTGANGEFAELQNNENEGFDTQTNTGDVTGGDNAEAGVVDQQRTSKQLPEVDAAFARMRRAEEELQRRDEWVSRTYGHMGIHTWDQYVQAVQQAEAEQQRQEELQAQEQLNRAIEELEAQGYNSQEIWQIMNANPEVQQLRQTVQQLQSFVAQQQQLQKQNQIAQALKDGHKKLREEYGDLVPDLDKIDPDTMARFYRGYPLEEAWVLSNKDKIIEHARKSGGQKVLNSVNSKQHLRMEGGGEEIDATTIPPDVLRMYRNMNPKWTLDQIVADYKKHNPKRR
jgi:DNA repair exonuclease SbcCD ATPase subunit